MSRFSLASNLGELSFVILDQIWRRKHDGKDCRRRLYRVPASEIGKQRIRLHHVSDALAL
jgi:hypothetical protein